MHCALLFAVVVVIIHLSASRLSPCSPLTLSVHSINCLCRNSTYHRLAFASESVSPLRLVSSVVWFSSSPSRPLRLLLFLPSDVRRPLLALEAPPPSTARPL